MKIVKYELSVIHKQELILTMEDDVDSEDLLKIFLETQMKEEKEQDGLIGIIAEKVSEDLLAEKTIAFFHSFSSQIPQVSHKYSHSVHRTFSSVAMHSSLAGQYF